MKNLYFLLITLFTFTYSNAQIVNIPDVVFKDYLVNYNCIDTDGDDIADSDADVNNDGEIQVSEAEAVIWLDVSNPYEIGLPGDIDSIVGIEYFINLKTLNCEFNSIESFDITLLVDLEYLNCTSNGLINLDVSQNPNLEHLNCRSNYIANLDVSQNPNLNFLWCTGNEISALNLSQNPNLELLRCSHNQLTELDVTQNPNLNTLTFVDNQISEIDISQNLLLELIFISQNQITNLNVTSHSNLDRLYCDYNSITELDISQNYNLIKIDISGNPISNMDFSQNLNVEVISAYNTSLTAIDVTNNLELTSLGFSDTNIISLDVSQNQELEGISIINNQIAILDLSQNSNLISIYLKETSISNLNIQNGNNSNIVRMTSLDNPNLTCIQVDDAIYSNNQECINEPLELSGWCKGEWTIYNENCSEPFVSILDINFLNTLVNTNCADLDGNGTIDDDVDTNDDGVIQIIEAEAVYGLYVSNYGITSMEGIRSFINLTSLDCSENQLSSLKISNGYNTNIINLDTRNNEELFCIQVDDENYANNAPNWFKDNWASYSEECILGLEDNNIISFKIYPNPTQNNLFIESQQQIESIAIYTLQGQLIKKSSKSNIDVSQLDAGLYFVQVTIEGKTIIKKFIKE